MDGAEPREPELEGREAPLEPREGEDWDPREGLEEDPLEPRWDIASTAWPDRSKKIPSADSRGFMAAPMEGRKGLGPRNDL